MFKLCSVCREEKDTSFFTKSYRHSSGYVSACKPCRADQSKKWVVKNKEKRQKIVSGYKSRNKGKPDKYYLKNKQRVIDAARRRAQQNVELERQRQREYAKRKPHIRAAKERRRVAAKLNATPKWANDFFIKEIYDLARLRTVITGIPWEVDHIVPLRSNLVCGLHVEHNLRVIPMKINCMKSNRYWPDMPSGEANVR